MNHKFSPQFFGRKKFFLASVAVVLFQFNIHAQFQRVANTTLSLPQQPPSYGFQFTPAFGRSSTFSQPLAVVTPPGENNRIFVVERAGKIILIPNLASPSKTVFLDITSKVETDNFDTGLLALAFHPNYAENGYFYVWYTARVEGNGRNILARYSVSLDNPNQASPDSELILINQYDVYPDHNGADIHFGPDGYLYLCLGDGGAPGAEGYDPQRNSQRIDGGFFSGMIRIDVDNREENLLPNPYNPPSENYPDESNTITPGAYKIPADNPFVGATSFNGLPVDPNQVRTEFWAVGLRNPFRFSFDDDTGLLYLGDVGQVTFEEINIIQKGGNYGWVFREGENATSIPSDKPSYSRELPPEFNYIDPIYQYSWQTDGKTVVGGFVYRGEKYPQLYGRYIFGDHINGWVRTLKYENGVVSDVQDLAALAPNNLVGFGIDPSNDDILAVAKGPNGSGSGGFVYRLVYSNDEPTGDGIPATLADTGVFSDLTSLAANPGIVPYDINVPFWSDHAIKSRWVSVPDVNQTIQFDPIKNWSFPTGTVWIKHFDLELTNGVPSSAKRLETRFIVKNDEGVYGVTYRWGDSTENAELVSEQGMDEEFTIYNSDGSVLRNQTWHYPSRVECLICHTPAGGFGLGFNTAQLNKDHDYDGNIGNQIQALSDAGYFETPVQDTGSLLTLAHASEESATLEWRVRSYLTSNCVQCHQPAGIPGQQANWDARISTPLDEAGIIDGMLANDFGNSENRVVKLGSLENSVLYSRVANFGAEHMPPLATSVLNDEAIALLAAWIGDGGSSFKISDLVMGQEGFSFSIQGTPESEVLIQSKANLSDTMWQDEMTKTFDSEGTTTFTDSGASGSDTKYYRAVAQ